MESSPWGVLLDGFDGTTAWSKNQNGVRTKDGNELSRAEKEADLRREVRLKELYPDLVFKATETLDGEQVQVLESKPTVTNGDLLNPGKLGRLSYGWFLLVHFEV